MTSKGQKFSRFSDEERTEIVGKYLSDFQIAISKGLVYECVRIARNGVKEFPNNYILLNKLMYALFIACSDDADIPEWKENMQKYDSEIVSLGERIIKYCPDQNIRLEATSRLAFQHCEMGRKQQGQMCHTSIYIHGLEQAFGLSCHLIRLLCYL